MSSLLLPLALVFGLALGAVAVSFFAFFRAKAMTGAASHRMHDAQTQFEGETQALRQTVETLAAQVQGLHQQQRVAAAPVLPKPGLNLSKRSQALRMNRRGDAPDRIATAPDIPLREVELLIKVHRIVISNVA